MPLHVWKLQMRGGGTRGEEGELWCGEGLAEAGWSEGNEVRSLGGDASLLTV